MYIVYIESKNLKFQPAKALAAAQLHKLKSETQILIKKNPWTRKRWHEPSLEYPSALSSSYLSLSPSPPLTLSISFSGLYPMKGAANKDEPQHMALCCELPYCFQTHVSECVCECMSVCVCTLRIEVISNKAVAAACSVAGKGARWVGQKGNKSLRKSENFLPSIFNDNLCLIFEYNCSGNSSSRRSNSCPDASPPNSLYPSPAILSTPRQTMAMCVNDVECMHKSRKLITLRQLSLLPAHLCIYSYASCICICIYLHTHTLMCGCFICPAVRAFCKMPIKYLRCEQLLYDNYLMCTANVYYFNGLSSLPLPLP